MEQEFAQVTASDIEFEEVLKEVEEYLIDVQDEEELEEKDETGSE